MSEPYKGQQDPIEPSAEAEPTETPAVSDLADMPGLADMPDLPKPLRQPVGPWSPDDVQYLPGTDVAYVPNNLLVIGEQARSEVARALEARGARGAGEHQVGPDEWLIEWSGGPAAEAVRADLRDVGVQAELNGVVFVHPCCAGGVAGNPVYANPVYANPVYANPVYANPVFAHGGCGGCGECGGCGGCGSGCGAGANPVYANPVYANPVYANPVYANPVYANPVYANEYRETGMRTSSAVPADEPDRPSVTLPRGDHRLLILDTGIAESRNLPPLLNRPGHHNAPSTEHEQPDVDGDDLLDPAAGHGTFIAGIAEQLVPERRVSAQAVLSTFGHGTMATIAARLNALEAAGVINDRTVLNLSFGAYVDAAIPTLARAIRRVQAAGGVVVASAGNDGTCTPMFPAALPGVIGVASVEGSQRAPYSNFGPWVRACAPGTGVVSSFFEHFDGSEVAETAGAPDPDDFSGWARWTGTSFAAPIVASALMRDMALTGGTAAEAVGRVIDDPSLIRLPGLGTVVNHSLTA